MSTALYRPGTAFQPDPAGLPAAIRGVVFALEGVLVDTPALDRLAWKSVLDNLLCAPEYREAMPFDPSTDFAHFFKGRSRIDGVRAFLGSRGITLPEGDFRFTAEPTLVTLALRKQQEFVRLLRVVGARPFSGVHDYLSVIDRSGRSRAAVTACPNCWEVMARTAVTGFATVVDTVGASHRGLQSTPQPDMFLEAARELHLDPTEVAAFVDSAADVLAACRAGYGVVVGVDRSGEDHAELSAHGADCIVRYVGQSPGAVAGVYGAR